MNALQMLGRQHWIRRGVRERVLRQFAPVERMAPIPFDVPFFGKTYRGRLNSLVDWNVFFYGCYEREILMLMRDILAPNSVFVDVGANVGHHTLFAAPLCAHVHAFEPFASVRAAMREKLTLNRIGNVTVYDCGLGESTAELPFFAPTTDLANQASGSFVPWHSPQNPAAGALPIRRGDDCLRDLTRLDLVKIDVEGYERSVLAGLRETIDRLRPSVLFEYSCSTRRDMPTLDAMRAMFPEGYTLHGVGRAQAVLGVFSRGGYHLMCPMAAGDVLATPKAP